MRRLAIFLLFVVFVASRAVAASSACPLVPRLFAAPLSFIASPVVANVAFAEDSLYTDGMGSVGALVPENGTAANAGHFRYDAYGNFRMEAHPGDCAQDPSGLTCNAPLTYTGHLYDQESNLFYFGARYYDPETGRFLTNDPVAGDALNPPSLHKYLYAYDSPMVYTDPWGEAVVGESRDIDAWLGQMDLMQREELGRRDNDKLGATSGRVDADLASLEWEEYYKNQLPKEVRQWIDRESLDVVVRRLKTEYAGEHARILVVGEGDSNEEIDRAFVRTGRYGLGLGVWQLLPRENGRAVPGPWGVTPEGIAMLAGNREVSLFVHGYNVDYESFYDWFHGRDEGDASDPERNIVSALQKAQYNGVVLGWYWEGSYAALLPNKIQGASFLTFPATDKFQVPRSVGQFQSDIASFMTYRSPSSKTGILAHSLGNEVVLRGLVGFEGTGRHIDNLVMWHAAAEGDIFASGRNWSDVSENGNYIREHGLASHITISNSYGSDKVLFWAFRAGRAAEMSFHPVERILNPVWWYGKTISRALLPGNGALGSRGTGYSFARLEAMGMSEFPAIAPAGASVSASHSPVRFFPFEQISSEMIDVGRALNK